METFEFHKLDAYQSAMSFLSLSAQIAERVPRDHAELAHQLRRAALAVPLHIARATAKWERDARQLYRIARGSTLRCAALLDVMETMGVLPGEDLAEGRQLLGRTAGMLTRRLLRSRWDPVGT